MANKSLFQELQSNAYPGRGIVVGRSEDASTAISAYFIMGRSENSRNRIFVADGEGLRTQAFDESKMKDPSLIIYSPVRVLKTESGCATIVTNGDQTDTIFDGMKNGMTFEQSLRSRCYEPDAPNYTPRISCVMNFGDASASGNASASAGGYDYALSILKSDSASASVSTGGASAGEKSPACNRLTFAYENPAAGIVRFIHTYDSDGNPLPSFSGEPKIFALGDEAKSIDSFTDALWQSLNAENKVSLFVRFIDIASGKHETRIVNKLK